MIPLDLTWAGLHSAGGGVEECVCARVCVYVLGVLGVFSVCLAAVNSAPHGQRLESTFKKKKQESAVFPRVYQL